MGGDDFGQMPAILAQRKSHCELFHECQLANEDTSGRDPADVRILVSTRPLVVSWRTAFCGDCRLPPACKGTGPGPFLAHEPWNRDGNVGVPPGVAEAGPARG